MRTKIGLFFVFSFIIFSLVGCDDIEIKEWIDNIVLGKPKISIQQGSTEISKEGLYSFEDTRVLTKSGTIFTIKNIGDSILSLKGSDKVEIIGINSDNFILSVEPDSMIPVGGSSTFQIDFAPTKETSYGASVTITSDDPDNPSFNFSLEGDGLLPFSHQIDKLSAYDAQTGDSFGGTVALSGDYAIAAAAWADEGATSSTGAAYIYYRTGFDTWDSGIKITGYDAVASDYFGWSAAIDGDYAIVGSPGQDEKASSNGAAYIFHRTGDNTWDNGIKILPTFTDVNAYFGRSVAISGDYAIVGAEEELNKGAVYFYHRDDRLNSWDSGQRVYKYLIADGSLFGKSVAIHGEYAIVGACGSTIYDTGIAYIYRRSGTTWASEKPIQATDAEVEDRFGTSVSIYGEYAVVGAPYEDGGIGGPVANSGAVYIFHRVGLDTWDTGTKIIAFDGEVNDYFGYSVSLYGDYLLVGAYGVGTDEGAAYIYYRNETASWVFLEKIMSTELQVSDKFGKSVSLGNEYALIGANDEDGGPGDPISNAGAAYFFK